jgi:catalase
MAFPIVSGIQKVESALKKTSSQDATEVTNKTKLTTDFGCPISNTDNWLKAVGPQRTGPSLLEDQIAREKVW